METLYLNGEIIAYKTTYISKNKDILLDKIHEIIKVSPNVTNDGYTIFNEYFVYFKDIIDYGTELCSNLMKENDKKYEEILYEYWINRVKKDNSNPNQLTTIENPVYHDHKTISLQNNTFIPNYTFVYYVQMQDNLIDNQGALLIKNKDGEIYTYYPKEHDLIIMDGDLPHSPVPALNSTKDRLVVACNLGFINNKKERTFL